MCLGIPGQVVAKIEGYGGQLILVDVVGVQRQINLGMLTDEEQAGLCAGDWVLIHMGFALERLDQEGAEQALAGLELMGRPRAADLSEAEQRPDIT
jgi:hydrogenase expression/formation protein HypC